MARLHELLAEHRAYVLAELERRVREAKILPETMSSKDVVDHVPGMLEALIEMLRRQADGVRSSEPSHAAARTHGYHRRAEWLDLRGVVQECALLRGILLDLARQNDVALEDEELRCLLHFIDVALTEATGEYVAHHDRILARERSAIEAERHRLRTALRLLPVGVAICDASGRTMEVNEAMRALWASSREPFRRATSDWPFKVWRAKTNDVVTAMEAPMARALRGETVLNEELEIEAYDGTRKTILSSSAPTHDEHERLTGSIVVNVDISAHAEALKESKLAVKTREDILAIVAHDLKNPLNAIQIAAARLVRGVDEESCRVLGETMTRAVGRMNKLVTDLLELAQLEAGHMLLDREHVDLRFLVREALEGVRPLARAKNVWLEKERLEGSPVVDCDRERIHQVLSNLLGNAVKFTPEGGSIYVRLVMDERRVIFEVADTGPGIAPDAIPHVFKRFWQAAATTHLGHGLGLAIARGIVEAHGGEIWVTSVLGAGSSFFFSLPLRDDTSSARWAIARG